MASQAMAQQLLQLLGGDELLNGLVVLAASADDAPPIVALDVDLSLLMADSPELTMAIMYDHTSERCRCPALATAGTAVLFAPALDACARNKGSSTLQARMHAAYSYAAPVATRMRRHPGC